MIGIVVLIAVLIVGGFIFFNAQKKEVNKNLGESGGQDDFVGDTKTSIHKDFRAVIQADWQELEIPPATYIYFPSNTSQEDVEAEVISVVVSPLGENSQSLEELTQLGIENSKKIMPDFELIENMNVNKGELTGKRLKFTGTSEGVKRNFVQFAGIQYNKLYALTYSCPINKCNYYELFNNFVETIELVKEIQK